MKLTLLSTLCYAALGDNSIIVGVEQELCNGELCGTAHGRYQGSQVCMRVNQKAIAYFGAKVGAVGDEKCSCIFSHRWHMKEGRNWEVVGAKTPECALAYLNATELNLIEASAPIATEETSAGRCATASETWN